MRTKWCGFRSVLTADIETYVEHKRALGHKFHTEERALRLLDDYLVDHDVTMVTSITPLTIEDFLASRPRDQPRSYNHLLGVVRCFFQWLVVQERLDESPVHLRPRRTTAQRRPFLFDTTLAHRLLDLAAALPDQPPARNRGATYHLIFAMMYALGLRVGEVCRLYLRDVDLVRNVLEIRSTKFAKDRLVPFGPRLAQRVGDYLAQKQRDSGGIEADDPLFSFNAGRPVHPGTISQTFHHLVSQHDFTVPPGVTAPRLHCLRHSFAVGTLLRWYRSGVDPNQRLIHLSTFMGHVDPVSTAWYLTITDELLAAANQRFEQFAAPAAKECQA